MSEEEKVVVFLDGVCRTIAGVVVNETSETITVSNPVIVNAVPTAQGQMSLQLIPVFFREILADQNEEVKFTYNKSQITRSEITDLEPEIMNQYGKLFLPVAKLAPTAVEDTEGGGTTIDLFPDTNKVEDKTDG